MLHDQAEPRSASKSPRAKAALAAASAAHFLHDGMADSLYVLLPIWAETLGLSYTEVGLLRSAYSASMAACQVGAGLLAERLGERALLAAGTALAGLAFAALAATNGFAGLLLAILLVGFGSSVQHPLASSIVSDAFPQARRRAALGVYNFFGDVGKMSVTFALATAAGLLGWKFATAAFGAMVAVSGVVLFALLFMLSLGARHRSPHAAPDRAASSKDAFTNPRGFSLLAAVHVVDSAARTGTLTLLPFVLIAKGASPATVGFALACVFAGGAMGKLVCGFLADRIGVIRLVYLTEAATAAVIVTAALSPLGVTLLLMPLLGIALNGTSSVLYGTVAEFVRADRQARAFGIFYTLGSFAGGSAPLALGAVSDWLGLLPSAMALATFVLATIPLAAALRPEFAKVLGPAT